MKPSIARRSAVLLITGIAATAAGCGSDTADIVDPTPAPPPPGPVPAPCPAVSIFAIAVDVIDATTGQPVTTATGSAVRTDGITIQLVADMQVIGRIRGGDGATQTGYWTVIVRAPGYRDWSIDGVGVPFSTDADPCPRAHQLNASLIRL